MNQMLRTAKILFITEVDIGLEFTSEQLKTILKI
jgi:hypothetical protein